MGLLERMDPELAPIFAALPPLGNIMDDLQRARQKEAAVALTAQMTSAIVESVSTADYFVPGPHGAPDVQVRVYRPAKKVRGALLWLHGGGFILGSIERAGAYASRLATDACCIVVAVAYRLAPEHPFPAAVEDGYAALLWLTSGASNIGVDATRVAIGGVSAGGGLAAAIALMARDRHGPPLTYQLLLYPALDDRHHTPSSHAVTDPRTWNRQTSLLAWNAYLGDQNDGAISPYAAPSRASDLAGLPPAYILAADLDLLRDENIEYASRLMSAGVRTELHVFPGAFHCFDGIAPEAQISRRAREEYVRALRQALS